jgi:Protein of unknown function (DUF2612)
MSGPPYPRYAPGFTPGSNSIGIGFAIGVSPIGILSPYDPWKTVLAQYANSPIITSMITSFNAALDQTSNFESLYDLVWNVATAQGYGLDVWGRIVGVTRVLKFSGTSPSFGFNEANSWTGFGQGGFFSGGSGTSNFVLSDSDFRTLILAKASGNICDGAIPSINAILLALFPNRGKCYVADGLNMSLTYTFKFVLNPVELAIVQTPGVLPNPAGVIINVSSLP